MLLDGLVAAAAPAAAELSGVDLTAAAYVRTLIRREARRALAEHGATSISSRENEPVKVPGEAVVRTGRVRGDDKHARAALDKAVLNGIKQNAVCRLVGISPSYLSRWKAGKQKLSETKLNKLLEVLESLR